MKSKLQIVVWSLLFLSFCACNKKEATTTDWTQFKKDNFRSATSTLNLDVEKLELAWTYTASQAPVPAWYGPAKEDAYARSGPLPSMRDYDLAYYPIVIGSDLYYSSSADDAVHCLNTADGKEKWAFTTGGPVRIAPVFSNGKLYFGSDDGFVYCIDAINAKLIWKYSPVLEKDRLLLMNSRLISFYPIRTGVLIEDNRVYFGASLLPWKKTYFCAINADTGHPKGEGCYVKEMENMTLEGAMASSGTMLIQPQGRIAPVFFSKADGEKKGSLPGTGGCFVLVTPDKHIIHPQTSRHKSIKEYVSEKEPEYMTFKGGKEMIVKGDTSIVLSDNSLSAYNRKSKKLLWLRRNYKAHRLIRSGNAIFVGATDTVYAVSPNNGLPLWKGKIDGTVYAMATADNALFVSTNEGKISCFRAGTAKNELFEKNLGGAVAIEEERNKEVAEIAEKKLELQAGPFLNAISTDSVQVRFITNKKSKINLTWRTIGQKNIQKKLGLAQTYEVILPVRKDFIYESTLSDEFGSVYQFEYDNFFNYQKKELDFSKLGEINKIDKEEISDLLKNANTNAGLAIVIGTENEKLPVNLARYSNYKVIVLEEKKSNVKSLRNDWQKSGIYGEKLSIHNVNDLNNLPVASDLANLLILNSDQKIEADNLIRLISPNGICIAKSKEKGWLKDSSLDWQIDVNTTDSGSILKKLPLEKGVWTHQYAQPDNSAFGGESFWGSSRTDDFEIQWMGRPGPRFQTDRSGRKPSPLAVNGRMFVQGNERIIAVDVYNGNILWSGGFPDFMRMNVHRDCSNWAADSESLYVIIRDNLLKIDQASGKINSIISLDKNGSDWGYIGIVEDKIIGSSITQNSAYTDFHGGGADGWYDAKSGANTHKVMSDELFMKDIAGKEFIWKYKPKGNIINATITQSGDKLCFVESNEKLSSGRGGDNIFKNTWLVALDLKSGKRLWRKSVKHMPGIAMYSMAAGSGKLVIVSSYEGNYKIYVYGSAKGNFLWEKDQKWFHGDHGGHFSRPAIVKNRLIVKPLVYDLNTGNQEDINVPKSGHGCATYALTEQSIFYRGGSVTQFNFDTREFSRWERLRPDCWLSTIPAQGMVLSPEAGGGCSCGNWLETSMVMAPISRAPLTLNIVKDKKPDYKQEAYGKYTQKYLPSEFTDSVFVSISVKPGVVGEVRYTIDGTEPTMNSNQYSTPIKLTESAEIKASIFIKKNGKIRQFTRTGNYTKLPLEPLANKEAKL